MTGRESLTVAELNRRISQVLRSIVGIFARADDGRVIAKGAGVLVSIDSDRLIFTASHVTAGTIGAGLITDLCLFPLQTQSDAVMRRFVPPEIIGGSSCHIIWSEEALDMAAITCPELEGMSAERFILGSDDAMLTREKLKTGAIELSSEKDYVPFLVCGFPNLGATVDVMTRTHLVSCVPFTAEVTSWDGWYWGPGMVRCPQFSLSLKNIDNSLPAPGLNEWELHIHEETQTATSEVENEAFGGISGGPVFCVVSDRCILSGIVKQGGRLFNGEPRAFASSWDDVFHAFVYARKLE